MTDFDKCESCEKIVVAGEAVILTKADYQRLVSDAPATIVPDYRMRSGTKIARNRDQAEFVIQCLASMTVTEAFKACVERFGSDAPSRAQVYRFAGDLGLKRATRDERRGF